MNIFVLTQDSTFIIGQVAWLLGKVMEGIFTVIDFIGVPNIGLAIILFTIVVNLLMMPLTIKQQKFSKLSAKMNPELQAIQAKYKDKKNQEAQVAQNAEIQAVYARYGVSPTGSCLYLIIQMPILFALYRVIQAMPAYVSKIGNTFGVLADKIMSVDGAEFLRNSGVESIKTAIQMYGSKMTDDNMRNGIIDVLNKLSTTDLAALSQHYDLSNLTYQGELILSNDSTRGLLDIYNNFLGLNMANSPSHIISEAMSAGAWILVIGALAIPVLSAVTQWINVKLMPQQETSGNDKASSMASSMKTMNMIMPLFSAWICFTMPSGLGLYWVAGSVVRSIQQILINRHIDKMDFDEIIKQNSTKNAKKIEKLKENQEKLNSYANIKTKSIQSKASVSAGMTEAEKEEAVKRSTEYYKNAAANPGSMFSKANMVKDFNEKNNKNR